MPSISDLNAPFLTSTYHFCRGRHDAVHLRKCAIVHTIFGHEWHDVTMPSTGCVWCICIQSCITMSTLYSKMIYVVTCTIHPVIMWPMKIDWEIQVNYKDPRSIFLSQWWTRNLTDNDDLDVEMVKIKIQYL